MSLAGSEKKRVASGVSRLDRLLGGLFLGDNVVWHDDTGDLAQVYCLNLIRAFRDQGGPLLYVSFDRSPKSLIDRLGDLAEYRGLTVMDCFTSGRGAGEPALVDFYEEEAPGGHPGIIRIDEPEEKESLSDALNRALASMGRGAGLVLESLTGIKELWGGEEPALNFYSELCPRVSELRAFAYWILEKGAHSSKFKARVNDAAQVVIELEVKRGTTSLTILKGEDRDPEVLHEPQRYWTRDLAITFDNESSVTGGIDLGPRLKKLRTKKGLSQTELAKLVGVTPSTISQVEGDIIYPSLPALLKMAEALAVDVSSFFQDARDETKRVIFPSVEAVEVKLPDVPEDALRARLLTPVDSEPKAEPYLIEIAPLKTLNSHFLVHKGDEVGYLLSGRLEMNLKSVNYDLRSGDVIYLTSQVPTRWHNPGPSPAWLLWIKIR